MEMEGTPHTLPQGETVPPMEEKSGETSGTNASTQPKDDPNMEMKDEK